MTVLKEVQPRVYRLTGGLFANWMPPDKVEVGDYGMITRECFQRVGNLRDYHLKPKVETTRKSDGKLEYSDRAEVSIKAALRTAVRIPGQKSPRAYAKLGFIGQGAFLYHLSGITTQRLANSRAFFEEMARKWISGQIKLAEKSVIIDEIRIADKATIVVSEGHKGSLELQGDFSITGQAPLAEVKGGLSVSTSAGSLFQWLAANDTIPIIRLARPVMGPPGGDPLPPNALSAFLRRIWGSFARNRWDVRVIQLRDYAANSTSRTVTAYLPNGETVSVGLQAVTVEEFFDLNDPGAEVVIDEGLGLGQAGLSIDDLIEEVDLGQAGEASA